MSESESSEKTAPESSGVPFETGEESGDVITSIDKEQEKALFGDAQKQSASPSSTEAADSSTQKAKMVIAVLSKELEPEKRFQLESERCLIGGAYSDLNLNDPFVSQWHAQIFLDDGELKLQDMHSENGVYLEIQDSLTLEDRDEIIAGDQRMRFRTEWGTMESEAHAAAHLGTGLQEGGARLLALHEGGDVAQVSYVENQLEIGRDASPLPYRADELLGSPHFAIDRQDQSYILKDRDSETGTFVRIHNPVKLIDGDRFVVGQTRIRIRIEDI